MAKRPANMSCPHCGGTLVPAHQLCDYCQSANPYYQAPRPAATTYTPSYEPAPVYIAPTFYEAADTFGKVVIWIQGVTVVLVTLCLAKGSWMAGLYLATGKLSLIVPSFFLFYGCAMGALSISEVMRSGCAVRFILLLYSIVYFIVMGCVMCIHWHAYILT